MKKRYIILGLIAFTIASFYINWNVYYVGKWDMYVIVEYKNRFQHDTVTVYLSDSRWFYGDNYVKYIPESAEMSDLMIVNAGDSLYAIERYMEIVEVVSKDYVIKPVYWIEVDKIRGGTDYWSDSTWIDKSDSIWVNNNMIGWIYINHRHGLYTEEAKRR